jgi:hypothetical protein
VEPRVDLFPKSAKTETFDISGWVMQRQLHSHPARPSDLVLLIDQLNDPADFFIYINLDAENSYAYF